MFKTTLSKYAGQFSSYLKRIDEDHFILLTHMHDLIKWKIISFLFWTRLETESEVKEYAADLSIGIAFGSESLNEIADKHNLI